MGADIMSNLDSFVRAYEGDLQYDFDNEILLNWYPKRILDFTKGSKSLLELGLGHGYTTSIFSDYFEKHIVLEGSKAVIENFKKKFQIATPKLSILFLRILFMKKSLML